MNATTTFKETIKTYLDNQAATDALFAETYKRENKNIDDCCTYILNQVQKSGCSGFADDEIFGMAMHYYDEEDIEVGATIERAHVVVNHVVEVSSADMEQAKREALEKYQEECLAELRKNSTRRTRADKEPAQTSQQSLFEL